MSRHDTGKRTKTSASRRKQRPVWMLVLMHILALGIALLVYALPHHVIPRASEAVGTMSTRNMMASAGSAREVLPEATGEPADEPESAEAEEDIQPLVWDLDLGSGETVSGEPALEDAGADAAVVTQTPSDSSQFDAASAGYEAFASPDSTLAPEAYDEPAVDQSAEPTPEITPEPTPEPTEAPVDEVGSFRIRFADKFTDGEVKKTKSTYQSENLNIKISKVKSKEWDTVYYVVDIYVADISCFMTAFAQEKYGVGYTAWPLQTAEKYKSIITMNGDQYGMRKNGVVIRNGKLYRNKKVTNDVCVLYWDGTMKTFSPKEFNANWEMASGAYQAWNFGPMLLDADGKAKTKFNSSITEANPRSAVGYFEPGHYCFVAVEGRNDESDGLSMEDLAKLMEKLGCVQAYNLDGGRTSLLYAGDIRLNKPAEGGRKSTDILMIVDYVTK